MQLQMPSKQSLTCKKIRQGEWTDRDACQSICHFSAMTILNKLPAIFLIVLLTSGCGGGNDPSTEDNDKDRKQILTHWADNIVIPSYQIFETKLDKVVTEVGDFKASPDAN